MADSSFSGLTSYWITASVADILRVVPTLPFCDQVNLSDLLEFEPVAIKEVRVTTSMAGYWRLVNQGIGNVVAETVQAQTS